MSLSPGLPLQRRESHPIGEIDGVELTVAETDVTGAGLLSDPAGHTAPSATRATFKATASATSHHLRSRFLTQSAAPARKITAAMTVRTTPREPDRPPTIHRPTDTAATAMTAAIDTLPSRSITHLAVQRSV